MIDEHKALTMDLLGLAAVAIPDPIGQASALLTAATVLIEREVGTAMAAAALGALLQPTVDHWAGAARPPAPSGPSPVAG